MMARLSVFDVAAQAMASQMVRMNTVASNLANANTVASSPQAAYHPLRPVFATRYAENLGPSGLAGVGVDAVVPLDRQPERLLRPGDPQADADGYVYKAPVNSDEEMVEMVDASRDYQNAAQAMSTISALMSRTLKMGQ